MKYNGVDSILFYKLVDYFLNQDKFDNKLSK